MTNLEKKLIDSPMESFQDWVTERSYKDKIARINYETDFKKKLALYQAYFPTSNWKAFWDQFGDNDSYRKRYVMQMFGLRTRSTHDDPGPPGHYHTGRI